MVDILKTNPGTRHIKIVVMTALSNESQRQKGEALGVDRYLVKSQVSIEDVVDVVHELLDDKQPVAAQAPIAELPNTKPSTAQYQAPGATSPAPLTSQPFSSTATTTEKKTISPLDPNLTLHGQPPHSAPSQPPTSNVLAPPTSPVTNIDLVQAPEAELPSQPPQSSQPTPTAPSPTAQPSAEPLVQIEDDPLQYKPQ